MLRITKMRAEGFASIKDLTFNWEPDNRLVWIKARNGTGKSKLINALYWGLYGKSLSGSVETWEQLRDKDYLGTKVTIWFTKDNEDYMIIRTLNYRGKVCGRTAKTSLFVFNHAGNDISLKDKRATQAMLEGILGYTPDLFCNTIIFAQKQKRLMDDRSTDKKKFFEQAFEVSIISSAYDESRSQYNQANDNYQELLNQKEKMADTISNMKHKLEMELMSQDRWETDMKMKLGEYNQDIKYHKKKTDELVDTLKTKISQVKDKIKESQNLEDDVELLKVKLDEVNSRIEYLDKEIIGLESEVKFITKSISQAKSELSQAVYSCPTCNRPFNKKEIDKVRDNIKLRISEFEDSLKTKSSKIDELMDKRNSYKKDARNYTSNINSIRNAIQTKKLLEGVIETHKTSIDNALKEHENYESRINKKIEQLKNQPYKPLLDCPVDEYQSHIKKLESKSKRLRKELTKSKLNVTRLKFAMEVFSNKGLKPWLFESLLGMVNDRLNEYESLSGFKVEFWVDLESANGDIHILVNRFGIPVPYEDLSGGQQQLVNLTTIFAINDVIKFNKPCNLFIADELFESLDRNNIEVVSSILTEKAVDTHTFIVSHLPDLNLQGSLNIELVNQDGITKIKD